MRSVVALAVLTSLLASCGGSNPTSATSQVSPAPVSSSPVSAFDLYVQANVEGNPLFADIYGITMNPLGVQRLTSGKRISSMDANAAHVVVAAADGDVDRLGYIADGGAIVDIPGLGRPNAFTPHFDRDGDLLFQDYTYTDPQKKSEVYRFFRLDERARKKSILFQGPDDLAGPIPMPDGLLAFVKGSDSEPGLFMVKRGSRTITSIAIPKTWGVIIAGARLVAIELNAPDSNFGKPTDLLLLDPKTGKQHTVAGWQPITFNPDGTELLVRRTASATDSELALLDPDHPDTPPKPLGTIPHLVIYHGAWVSRT
jgi:hypothetical protein